MKKEELKKLFDKIATIVKIVYMIYGIYLLIKSLKDEDDN